MLPNQPSRKDTGTAVQMYLKCIGMYDVVGDDGTDSYPYFDLQFVK